MPELKDCKFCGGRPWYEAVLMDDDNVGTYIECSICSASTEIFIENKDAEKAWNDGAYSK